MESRPELKIDTKPHVSREPIGGPTLRIRSLTAEEINDLAADPSHVDGDRLLDFVEGSLIGQDKQAVEKHLMQCEFCRDQFSYWKQVQIDGNSDGEVVRAE